VSTQQQPGLVASVNLAHVRPSTVKGGSTGIDKRPAAGPVHLAEPPPGASGVDGDTIGDGRHHGGPDQAVYAYAVEDLQAWAQELERNLPPGSFGENLTTRGVDVNGALIGERWRVGQAVLRVTVPRVPCRTFAVWLEEQGWIRRFTERAVPGAYLAVEQPGEVRAGDRVEVLSRPPHAVSVGLVFRALTSAPELLPELLVAGDLPADVRVLAQRRVREPDTPGIVLDDDPL
jgi:MOSC domain-containing protein YiiM